VCATSFTSGSGCFWRGTPRLLLPTRGTRPRWRRWFARLLVMSAVLIVVLGVRYAGTWLIVSRPLQDANLIVSLASHEWERLPLVARLAQAMPDAHVLLTEPQPSTPFNCHDCANRVNRLRHLGVDEARVLTLPIAGHGTYGEALTVLAFARENGVRRVLVATSPYHTRRSLAAFRKVFDTTGIEIGIEPATSISGAQPSTWWWHGYDRAYVPYEWAAIVYYGFRYGVSWKHYR
jgi:uncharacterized SAM-binding protein YcdF (DUF218 family)